MFPIALGSNEKEYRCDGMSHAQPRVLLSRQIAADDRRLSQYDEGLLLCGAMAMPKPENPVPMPGAGTYRRLL